MFCPINIFHTERSLSLESHLLTPDESGVSTTAHSFIHLFLQLPILLHPQVKLIYFSSIFSQYLFFFFKKKTST